MAWSAANGDRTPTDFSTKSREMIWWSCRKCGHQWKASIYNRCHGKWTGCPHCAKAASKERAASSLRKKRMKEQFDLHYEEIAVKKWIDETDVRVTYDDSLIGVPIDYYFPDYKSVLILPKPFHNNYHGRKIQRAVNDLLRKKKVKLVRILDMTMDEYEDCVCIRKADDSKEAFDAAFAEAVEAIMK